MAGILWLTPRLYTFFTGDRKRGKAYNFVAASLAASLGALALSTPLSVYYFGILCLISPISNLLCLAAVFCLLMGSAMAERFGVVSGTDVLNLRAEGSSGRDHLYLRRHRVQQYGDHWCSTCQPKSR